MVGWGRAALIWGSILASGFGWKDGTPTTPGKAALAVAGMLMLFAAGRGLRRGPSGRFLYPD